MDLADLVSPLTAEEFQSEVLGTAPRLFRGEDPDRFGELISWETLSGLVSRENLPPSQLRVTRDGRPVPETEYARTDVLSDGGVCRTALVPGLAKVLGDGATLVMDAADRTHPPLERLARRLERTLRDPVQVNVYGAWGVQEGFGAHWDDHDVLILHAVGKKEWTLFGPPRRTAPLEQDVADNPVPQDEAERAVLTLTPGDVLYVPRGWWHAVRAVEGPALHLTVGMARATGVDLMHWLTDQLCGSAVFRADLPRGVGPGIRETRRKELAGALSAALDDPALLERFFTDRDAHAEPRHRHSLGALGGAGPAPYDAQSVAWLAPRAVLEVQPGHVCVLAGGQRLTFAAAARGILEHLLERLDTTVGSVVAVGTGRAGLSEEAARGFLVELVEAGLVAVPGAASSKVSP